MAKEVTRENGAILPRAQRALILDSIAQENTDLSIQRRKKVYLEEYKDYLYDSLNRRLSKLLISNEDFSPLQATKNPN